MVIQIDMFIGFFFNPYNVYNKLIIRHCHISLYIFGIEQITDPNNVTILIHTFYP
jgi:hypothetical protein